MIDVSIIFVNYNTIALLCDAIDSVLDKTSGIKYEILVVDNGSSDNSQDVLQKRYGSAVSFIKLKENIGFGRANNEGIKKAKGRNIFLLNPDTLLVNNAIKILSDFLDKNTNVGVCGGNLFSDDMIPTASYRRYLPSVLSIVAEFFLSLYKNKNYRFNHTLKPKKVGYISGADMMIKRSVLDKSGVFDPDFFMYAEESELTYRISKLGYSSFSVPEAKIIHLEGKSIEFSEQRSAMLFSGVKLYFKKRYGQIGECFYSKFMQGIARYYMTKYWILQRKPEYQEWKAKRELYHNY